MALSDEKKQSLIDLQYSPEQIKEIEERMKQKADEAKAAGIQSKEAEAPPEAAPEVPPKEEPKAEEPKAEEAKTEEPKVEEPKVEEPKAEEDKELPLTRKEVVEGIVGAIAKALEPYEKANKELQAEVNRMGKVIADMDRKAKEDAKKELSMTPTASLLGMISREMSVRGKSETLVDGRSSLVKSGPEEVPANDVKALPSFMQRIIPSK